ncbi:SAM-dependent methyltransferase [Bacteroidia bacterium]|nr:SAM-dependent methyltransferase [Bacteroidia bacterium]
MNWTDYELLDSGGFEKLERFGPYIIARPEPQAIWNKSLSEKEWQARADAYFRVPKKTETKKTDTRDTKYTKSEERGEWVLNSQKPQMPPQWYIHYQNGELKIRLRLGLTAFKHLGVFPEQAENWDFIYQQVRKMSSSPSLCRVLNLFAYTGGASLSACSAGADVTHIDSVKPVITWARENMEASGLDGIRWIVDDALKFARREVKRGNTYNGIILDPPSYGRGPEGEKWVLEENINELLTYCGQLLERENRFIVLNLYSMGLSATLARTAVRQLTGTYKEEQFGELFFTDSFDKSLPLGVFYRGGI